jgi:protein O-GlcNAc transferase
MNINKALRMAFECHGKGNLDQAEYLYKKILTKVPNNPDILCGLGALFCQKEEYDLAIRYIEKGLQLGPADIAEAHNNLGLALQEKGRLEEAIDHYQESLRFKPSNAEAYNNLGDALQEKGCLDEAIVYYQKALQFKPSFAEAYNNLGDALQEKGCLDEAIAYYQKALQFKPSFAEAHYNLGCRLQAKGQLDEAITCYQKAIGLNLKHPFNNLGLALKEKGLLYEAIDCFQKAIDLRPNFAHAYNNLGNALKDLGQMRKAQEHYRHALQIEPDNAHIFSNILLTMNYDPGNDAQAVFREHLEFGKKIADSFSSVLVPHMNNRDPDRRLRIGYLSPDFRRHSVAYFIEPVLSSHDRGRYEIFCYSDVLHPDDVTRRIEGYADVWRPITRMSDEEVAVLIRSDRIDILIDLAGHTDSNRMLVFARKPAPVQATWIGYPATTGLSAMDYKIVDSHTDPPGLTEQFYTEKLIRLPETFLCYQPVEDSPDVGESPFSTLGGITFGSFNNYSKISDKVLSLWIKILKSVPGSRLVLKAKIFTDGKVREEVAGKFAGEGIEGERIELCQWRLSARGHLELYNRVDIGLDTFPYNGTTTTCEALWMGVPVITIAGSAHASRVGVSILSNIGLPDFVAEDEEGYARKAVDLAHDTTRLLTLRKSLRDMMLSSSLMDARLFTANLENCYRSMWKAWCGG